MEWVFNTFIAWLLNIMLDCFNTITIGFFEFFSIDTINAFFTFFPALKTLQTSFAGVGYAIVVILATIALAKNLIVSITDEYEDPIKIGLRVIGAVILVTVSVQIVNYEVNLGNICYETVEAAFTDDKGKLVSTSNFNWKDFKETFKNQTDSSVKSDASGAGTVVQDLIIIGCLVGIFFNFIKMLLEAAERYVVVALSTVFAPIVSACVTSANMARVFSTYLRTIFNQLLLMSFNLIFVLGTMNAITIFSNTDLTGKGFAGSVGYAVATGGVVDTKNPMNNTSVGNVFTFMVLVLAFLIAGQKMDQYMRQIGLDVVQTGGMLNEIRSGLMSVSREARQIGMAARTHGMKRNMKAARRASGNTTSQKMANAINKQTGGTSTTMGGMMARGARDVGLKAMGRSDQVQKLNQGRAIKDLMNPDMRMNAVQLSNNLNKALGGNLSSIGLDPNSNIAKMPRGGVSIADGKNKTSIMFGEKPEGYQALYNNKGEIVPNAWIKSNNPMAGLPQAAKGEKLSFMKDGIDDTARERALLNTKAAHDITNLANRSAGLMNANGTSTGKGTLITPQNVSAISDGRGGFKLVNNAGEKGMQEIGRIVSANDAKTLQSQGIGVSMVETGMGGNVGFISSSSMSSTMADYKEGRLSSNIDSAHIPFKSDDHKFIDASYVQSSLRASGALEANNIEPSALPLSIDFDDVNKRFSATYSDGNGSIKEVYSNFERDGNKVDAWDNMAKIIGDNENGITTNIDEEGKILDMELFGDTLTTDLFNYKELESEYDSRISNWGIDNNGHLKVGFESGEEAFYADASVEGIHGNEIAGKSGIVWTKLNKKDLQ